MSGPGDVGMVLSGPVAVFTAPALRAIVAAFDLVEREMSRDGAALPPVARVTRDLARDGLAAAVAAVPVSVASAAGGSDAAAAEAIAARFGLSDPIDATEVAVLLKIKPRGARDLLARGSFESATKVTGRWYAERAEVLARADERGVA